MDSNTEQNLLTTGGVVYFIIVSFIFLSFLYYGSTEMHDLTSNKVAYVIFYGTSILIYILALGMYYLDWSPQSIIVFSMLMIALVGVVVFFIMYFGAEMCENVETHSVYGFLYSALVVLLFVASYLGLEHRNNYKRWTLADTIRFIAALGIIRYTYYLMDKYEYDTLSNFATLVLGIVLFYNIRRIYKILRSPTE